MLGRWGGEGGGGADAADAYVIPPTSGARPSRGCYRSSIQSLNEDSQVLHKDKCGVGTVDLRADCGTGMLHSSHTKPD